jgi:hypothetical protein
MIFNGKWGLLNMMAIANPREKFNISPKSKVKFQVISGQGRASRTYKRP